MTDTHATAFDPALDLELRRETDVPPRLVWRAWTEPKLLMQWSPRRPGRRPPASSTCVPAASSTR